MNHFPVRNLAGYQKAVNNLASHVVSAMTVHRLVNDQSGIHVKSATGDPVGSPESVALDSNTMCHISGERASAGKLHHRLLTAMGVIKGSIAPTQGLIAAPSPLVAACAEMKRSADTLAVFENESEIKERRVDKVSILANLQQNIAEVESVISLLDGLESSHASKRFKDLQGQETKLQNRVDSQVSFALKKSADSLSYSLPLSLYN